MKKFLLSLVLLHAFWLLTQTECLFAGKINFGWNLYNTSGLIFDIQFMPDQNSFIMATENDIQIRNTITGELEKIYPNIKQYNSHIAFTHDSTRLILANGKYLQLRNLQDMSIIRQDSLFVDAEDSIPKTFYKIEIDPIKPLVYVIGRKSGKKFGYIDPWIDIRKIMIYNYETLQKIGELTSQGYENEYCSIISISKDGKYLAALNEINTFLKVWSLDSIKEVRSLKLSQFYVGGSGNPSHIKFSEINFENIYFSGDFPQFKDDDSHRGLFIYNIQSNKIIDSTFGVGNKRTLEGYFSFLDNEDRIIITYGGFINVLNIKKNIIEYSINVDTTNLSRWVSKIIYSQKNNKIIGFTDNSFSLGFYDSTTGIIENPPDIKTMYPNPTNNLININNLCTNLNQRYDIYDINGIAIKTNQFIMQGQNSLTIDFSQFKSGIYILRIYCGENISIYKIIKEG